MKKMTLILVITIVAMVMAACGQKESAPSYPKMQETKAKEALHTYMSLQGYDSQLTIQKQVKNTKTKDGRPALIYVMASKDNKKKEAFIVSINKNEKTDYTADILNQN